jgi:hypothetical protein
MFVRTEGNGTKLKAEISHLWWGSNCDGAEVLSVQVVGQGFRVRSGAVPTPPGEADRSVNLFQSGSCRFHAVNRNSTEFCQTESKK